MTFIFTDISEFCITKSADGNSLEYALIAVKDKGGLVYHSEEMISLIRSDTVRENELHRYVLENSCGMPSSICDHAAATQYGISNHYYDLGGDEVKIFHKIRNFSVVKRRNMKTHQKLVRHNNTKLTKVLGQ